MAPQQAWELSRTCKKLRKPKNVYAKSDEILNQLTRAIYEKMYQTISVKNKIEVLAKQIKSTSLNKTLETKTNFT
mgnify:CR=1 FL=1